MSPSLRVLLYMCVLWGCIVITAAEPNATEAPPEEAAEDEPDPKGCCAPVIDSSELSTEDVRLLTTHGVIHIIFWCGLMLLHVAFIMYKRYITNDPFLPPHDPRYRIYMLFHHIFGAVDIGAIIMALSFAGKQGDTPDMLLDDQPYAGGHRVAGVIILPLAFLMEMMPVFFGRFSHHPKISFWLRWWHMFMGKALLAWVLCFQIWSGIIMIDWDRSTLSAVYTWIISCLIVIFSLIFAGKRIQAKRVTALSNKYTTHDNKHGKSRVIMLTELQAHASEKDVWVAINGYVVDVTDFLHDHPGGAAVLMKFAGKDASYAWNLNHERGFISQYVAGLVVGTLEGADPAIMDSLYVRSTATHGEIMSMGNPLTDKQTFGTKFTGPRVIVIGGGLSGLSAAHSALQQGARVLVLDKMAFCGGNSMKATSGINGANTRIQAALNIQDNWEQFCSDTYKSAAKGAPDAHSYDLAEILTSKSADAVHWLIDHFSLNLCEVGRLAGQSAPRTHRGATRFPGMMITSKLLDDLKNIANDGSGTVEIINRARVVNLIKEKDTVTGAMRITGVEYEAPDGLHKEKDGCVVIATGGWAADFTETSLLARYRPDLLNLPTTNGEHCTGDGVKLAESIGAGLIGLDNVQVHPTGLVDPTAPNAKVKTLAAEALRGADGLIFNTNGQRFCNELGRRDYVSGEMMKNQGPFWLVLNSSGHHEMKWHLEHYGSMGLFRRVDSGAELAKLIGCLPRVLDATFKLYQSHAAYQHEIDISGKPSEHEPQFWAGIMPIKDPYGKPVFKYPAAWRMDDFFYVAQITTVVHYCMGGIKINPSASVCLNGPNSNDYYTSDEAHGNVAIPGLYACGETTGGVHGKNRLGGSSLLDCVVFGKIAGTNAAKYLEGVTGRKAMIGVETVDSSDPDMIVEAANKRLLAAKAQAGGDAKAAIATTSFTL